MKTSLLHSWIRRSCWRLRRWQWWWLVGTCIAVAGAVWPKLVFVQSQENFLGVAPHRLAHLLTDFNNHLQLYPNLGSWAVQEEASNYSSWSYKVQYECGRRCRGLAHVALHERTSSAGTDLGQAHGLLQHGHQGKSYHIMVSHIQCSLVPLMSWIQFCDKWDYEAQIQELESGKLKSSVYKEQSWRSCSALRALTGGCAAELRDERRQHLHNLQRFLTQYEE